jgi:hypothetical protein
MNMHDWRILSLHFHWASAKLELQLVAVGGERYLATFTGVSDLAVPRKLDWGYSDSINSSSSLSDSSNLFQIELQSGDVISIRCTSHTLERK